MKQTILLQLWWENNTCPMSTPFSLCSSTRCLLTWNDRCFHAITYTVRKFWAVLWICVACCSCHTVLAFEHDSSIIFAEWILSFLVQVSWALLLSWSLILSWSFLLLQTVILPSQLSETLICCVVELHFSKWSNSWTCLASDAYYFDIVFYSFSRQPWILVTLDTARTILL